MENRLGLVIGDVCGKGLSAAAVTSVCRHMLRAYALEDPAPENVLRRLNHALCTATAQQSRFVTLIYGVLDLASFEFTYANAGHPAAIVCASPGGPCRTLRETGGMLGVIPDWTWKAGRVRIEPGGVLVLLTDGILEARRGAEQFGIARAESAVCRLLAANSDLAIGIKEQALDFTGDELKDDLAIVAVKRLPASDHS